MGTLSFLRDAWNAAIQEETLPHQVRLSSGIIRICPNWFHDRGTDYPMNGSYGQTFD
jgi:hypothetical protein